MAIYISKKLKQFRKARGLTQEQISEIFNVSIQSVSRWETGVTYPDIELLPSLAEFYKITVDDLLGIDVTKNQERIAQLKKNIWTARHQNSLDEAIKMCRNAVKEFPNNYKLLFNLAHLFDLKANSLSHDLKEQRKWQDEVIDVYERIIGYAPNGSESYYQAFIALAATYNNIGNKEKAREIAEKLPNAYIQTSHATMAFIAQGEEAITQHSSNIKMLLKELMREMHGFTYWKYRHKSSDKNSNISNIKNQIEINKKKIGIMELLFEKGDYGFSGDVSYSKMISIYWDIGRDSMIIEDYDSALNYIEKAEKLAIIYDTLLSKLKLSDTLPELYTHESILLEGYEDKFDDLLKSEKLCEHLIIRNCLEWEIFNPIRETERFKAIVAELEEYVKKYATKEELNMISKAFEKETEKEL